MRETSRVGWSDLSCQISKRPQRLSFLLKLPERNQQDQSIILNACKSWLQQNQGWLLILDNADDLDLIKELLPRKTRGHILITTRSQVTGTLAQRIEIEEMNPEEGALFLLRRTRILNPEDTFEQASEQDQQQAQEITKLMAGLPLALDQAGAYIDETRCGLDGYIQLFQKRQSDLLQRRGKNVLDHPDPVATTWSLSFEKVQQANAMAVDILSLCAFLDPDSIFEQIFTQGATKLGPVLSTIKEDPLAFNDAITELLNYSLIRRTPDHILTIHSLVQLMLKNGMDQDVQRLWAERTVQVINYLFPPPEYRNWPICLALLPQAKNSAALIKRWRIESAEAARLLNEFGMFLEAQGEYKEAYGLIERAMVLYKKVMGEEHPDTAGSLNNLAVLYERQGRYEEAEPLYGQALEIYKKVLGEEHPSTVTSVNNLAFLYAGQGRYEEAEPLYLQALEIRKRVLGEEHPSTARSFGNLARLYERQGRYKEAEPLYEQALEIHKKVLGEEHPDIATGLNNLAGLYTSQGRYEEAELLYEQALEIYRKVLGEEHPDIAIGLNNLARFYTRQGRYEEAELLHVEALKISVKALGEKHSMTLAIAENYAYFLKMKEDGQKS